MNNLIFCVDSYSQAIYCVDQFKNCAELVHYERPRKCDPAVVGAVIALQV